MQTIDKSIWPDTIELKGKRGASIGEIPISHLARKYQTPLIVIDRQTVANQILLIKNAFSKACEKINLNLEISYATKAFSAQKFFKYLNSFNINFDASTLGELLTLFAADIDPKKITMHGNNKSREEIELCIKNGIGSIVIDSIDEIDFIEKIAEDFYNRTGALGNENENVSHETNDLSNRLNAQTPSPKACPKAINVMLRINTGVHAETHLYLATAAEDQKFGIPLSKALDAYNKIKASKYMNFLGFHAHIGSQIFASEGFYESIRRLLKAYSLTNAKILNIGGGFGVKYIASDTPKPIDQIANRIIEVIDAESKSLNCKIETLQIEPGRFITARAGITLYSVGNIKEIELYNKNNQKYIKRFISIDGGMSDNIRPALYQAKYSYMHIAGGKDADNCQTHNNNPEYDDNALVLNNVSRETICDMLQNSEQKLILTDIVGKHCESGDKIISNAYLPNNIKRADFILIASTGAYCYSLASNYNQMQKPCVIFAHNGESEIIIPRQNIKDIIN